MTEDTDYIDIYTDGSSRNNNKEKSDAGAAFYIVNTKVLRAKYVNGTNSYAELSAIQYALWYCLTYTEFRKIRVFSDSEYAIGVVSGTKKANAHVRLVSEIKKKIELMEDVKFEHVDGHSGVEYNELVDKAAKSAAKNGAKKIKTKSS